MPDPRDTGGRLVVVGLELFGIGTLFYGLATVAEFFVSGQLSGLLEERRNQKMIDSYSDHFIICGFGRVGRQVARDLRGGGNKAPGDRQQHREPGGRTRGRRSVHRGRGRRRGSARAAGIERARGVIACVDSDAENIFITMTARELRSDIQIIARASAEDSEKKLLRAGADRVISPYKTSGSEMARVALHPQVGGAVEVADYRMEEIEVSADCDGAGKTIGDVRGGSVIVALRRHGGGLEPQPVAADGDRRRGTSWSRSARPRRSSGSRACSSRSAVRDGAVSAAPCGSCRRAVRAAAAAVRGGGGEPAPQPRLERAKHEGQGDYSTNAAMLLAPALGRPPRVIAERIGDELGGDPRRRSSSAPRSPDPGSSTCSCLTPGTGARWRRCWRPASGSAPVGPIPRSGS